jgi:hypothetical protein
VVGQLGLVPIIHLSFPSRTYSPYSCRHGSLGLHISSSVPAKWERGFSPGSNQERRRRQQRQEIAVLTNAFSIPTARPHPARLARALVIERPEARCACPLLIYPAETDAVPVYRPICVHVRAQEDPARASPANESFACLPITIDAALFVLSRSYSDRKRTCGSRFSSVEGPLSMWLFFPYHPPRSPVRSQAIHPELLILVQPSTG